MKRRKIDTMEGGLGRGIYGPSEAARLVGLRAARVRRWLTGYEGHGKAYPSPVALRGDYGDDDDFALSFLDLVDVLVVREFLRHDVPLRVIRAAADRLRGIVTDPHPFAVRALATDGEKIFAKLRDPRRKRAKADFLIDLGSMQTVLKPVFAPLLQQIEYGLDERAQRWWPLGRKTPVVVDPARSFGAPIVVRGGVQTRLIRAAANAGEPMAAIARWYDLKEKDVEAALAFEKQLDARQVA